MTEVLLSAQTYAVLQKVPQDWMDEAVVKESIAAATAQPVRTVAMRLTRLRTLNLVERRAAPEIERSAFELRRVAGREATNG